jgi:hypothetical protein
MHTYYIVNAKWCIQKSPPLWGIQLKPSDITTGLDSVRVSEEVANMLNPGDLVKVEVAVLARKLSSTA